jgi:hypothetical protein
MTTLTATSKSGKFQRGEDVKLSDGRTGSVIGYDGADVVNVQIDGTGAAERPIVKARRSVDALMQAAIDLEVAVDDYTFGVYVNVTNPDPEDVPVSTLKAAVVAASKEVALAMHDADVEGYGLAAIIPAPLRSDAAEAEIAALRGNAKLVTEAPCKRCAGTGQFITYVENGVPKGPGGPCFRCNGKGIQTVADHRRNYGYDGWGVKLYA